MFLARVERLPVTSRSHVTDITDVTDKCKISIMIMICIAHTTHALYDKRSNRHVCV